MALRYYHEFRDRGNHLHRVEIHSDTIAGGSELITHSTGKPTQIKHAGSRDKPKIIKGKEFQFSFYVFDYDHNKYDDIIESDFKDFYVLYEIDGLQQFYGWVNPENLSREHFKEAYVFNLSATDGLAWLKDVSFRNFLDDQIIEGNHTFLEFIQSALEWIEIELPYKIQLNTWETTAMTANQCALNELGGYSQRFLDQGSGNPISCYKLIEEILKPFSCTLKQENGYYLISNKHELDSPARIFAWSTLAAGTIATSDKITDLSGYKYEKAELSKISPKKEIEIIWKNRDLGLGASGVDLTDWSGNYTHTFDELYEGLGLFPGVAGYTAVDEVRLQSGTGFSGDYIELTNVFSVTRESDEDFIRVSFSHRTYPRNPGTWNDPFIQIEIYKPSQGWIPHNDFIALTLTSNNYPTPLTGVFRVHESGDYNIRLTFYSRNANSYDGWFFLKDLTINKVHGALDADAGEAENLILDAWYLQDSESNVGKLEETTLLGDAVSLAMCGAILDDPTGTPAITAAWTNSYTGASAILLMDVWARNVLNDRYVYKSFLRFNVHDIDNSIYLDSVLSIEDKYYTIISYSRDGKMGLVQCDVEELLTTVQSYEDIQFAFIDEVDGVSTTQSENSSNESAIAHNFTQGIQGGAGGEYYHLLYAQWSELSNWLDNVVLSDAGGIDMDGNLEVDQILEHTPAAGVMLEMVNFSTAAITTAETNMSFQDGTTGPHTLSDLIASAGYWSRTGTVLSPTNAGDTIKISAASNQIQIVDSDDSRAWNISANAGILLIYDVDNTCYPFVIGTNTQNELFKIYSDQVKINNKVDSFASQVLYISQDPVTTQASEATVYVRGETSGSVLQLVQEGTGHIAYFMDSAAPRFIFTQAGVLEVDTIDELTGSAGVTIEGNELKDGGITLGTGPAVDTIETTLTDDNTHLPTSGAVYDAISGVSNYWDRAGTTLSPTNAGDNVQIDGGILTVNTINEYTGAAGVTIDSLLIKDGNIGESTDYQGTAYLTSWVLKANTHLWNYVYPYSDTDSICWQDCTYRYGGTIASPAAAPTGAYISHKRSFVHDGGANREVLRFSAQIDGAVASDNVAGRWLWLLRPSGISASLAIKMTLDEAGLKLNVGSLALPSGASVDNIETTLTNDATHIANSAAIYAAIAGASPAAHTHGNITNAGAIGSTTNLPIITTTAGVLIASSFGTGANTFCQGNDSRLSDSRTPTAHAASHHTGGSDLVNHDSLTGFVAAEHYSHTAISMGTAANSGLNGGGTIAVNRALVLAVNNLTAITTLQTTDYFPFYDASESGTRRISYANLITELNGDLSFGASDITMDGSTANGVITYGGADNIDVEANLTFDGSILTVTGDIDCTRFTTEAYGILMIGSDTGDTNLSYIGFYASNGTTRQGYIGIASSGNDDLYVYAQTGDLLLESVTGAVKLDHAGDVNLETTATGVKISGGLLVDNSGSHTALNLEGNTAVTNSGLAIASLSTVCSGSSTEGFGPSLYFYYSDTGVTDYLMGYLSMLRDDAGDTDSIRFEIWTSRSTGNPVLGFMQDSAGIIHLPELQPSAVTASVRWDSGSTPAGQLTYPSSDAWYKKNITDWKKDALSVLGQFEPKQFMWKEGPSRIRTGWIAQEGIDFIPDMFPMVQKTNRYSLAEFEILPYFHRGINQLVKIAETHEKKINRLERHIIQLETKINNYENETKRPG